MLLSPASHGQEIHIITHCHGNGNQAPEMLFQVQAFESDILIGLLHHSMIYQGSNPCGGSLQAGIAVMDI